MIDVLTAGVDEVGRGPRAGPVVAAAVVLDPARRVDGLRDSQRRARSGSILWDLRSLTPAPRKSTR